MFALLVESVSGDLILLYDVSSPQAVALWIFYVYGQVLVSLPVTQRQRLPECL